MFSEWYARKDTELMTGGQEEQLEYAKELLAELLDRAQVLANMYQLTNGRRLDAWANPPIGAATDYTDYREASEWLLHAVGIFMLDASEALARARRARLVYGSDPVGGIETGSVDEDLDSIGGALVPLESIDEALSPEDQEVRKTAAVDAAYAMGFDKGFEKAQMILTPQTVT